MYHQPLQYALSLMARALAPSSNAQHIISLISINIANIDISSQRWHGARQ